jgi:hypothetical protein
MSAGKYTVSISLGNGATREITVRLVLVPHLPRHPQSFLALMRGTVPDRRAANVRTIDKALTTVSASVPPLV